MRRTRNGMVNVVLFLTALVGILYSNSPTKASSIPKKFAWTKVRYRTRSDVRNLSSARGSCPDLSESITKPVLVVARIESEPSSWLDELSSNYHICPYTADAEPNSSSAYLQTPANRGHESMAYLTFVIDNYEDLPSTGIVFVHGNRFQWHNDDPLYDNLSLLKRLNVHRTLWGPPGLPTGYWNLKCDWSAGTCDASSPDARPQGSLETRTRALLEHQNKRIASDLALVGALQSIFGGSSRQGKATEGDMALTATLGRSDAIRSQCCAQFVVARENIWRHTKEEYIALRQWLLDGSEVVRSQIKQENVEQTRRSRSQYRTSYDAPAPADDLIAGRVLAYIWHILFLPPSLDHMVSPNTEQSESPVLNNGIDISHLNTHACPSAEECYCRLYGRCSLEGCTTPGRCLGQYQTPPAYSLPKDWAERHS